MQVKCRSIRVVAHAPTYFMRAGWLWLSRVWCVWSKVAASASGERLKRTPLTSLEPIPSTDPIHPSIPPNNHRIHPTPNLHHHKHPTPSNFHQLNSRDSHTRQVHTHAATTIIASPPPLQQARRGHPSRPHVRLHLCLLLAAICLHRPRAQAITPAEAKPHHRHPSR
jgi:hypothetical protein